MPCPEYDTMVNTQLTRQHNKAAKALSAEVTEQGVWGGHGKKHHIPGVITLDHQPFSLDGTQSRAQLEKGRSTKCCETLAVTYASPNPGPLPSEPWPQSICTLFPGRQSELSTGGTRIKFNALPRGCRAGEKPNQHDTNEAPQTYFTVR